MRYGGRHYLPDLKVFRQTLACLLSHLLLLISASDRRNGCHSLAIPTSKRNQMDLMSRHRKSFPSDRCCVQQRRRQVTTGRMFYLSFFLALHGCFLCYHVSAEGAPRKLTMSDDEKIIFTHVGQSLELKCPVEIKDDAYIFIEWYRGGSSLYMEPGYESNDHEAILQIKSVAKEHSGIFTCEGVNGYGFVQVNITVIVDNSEIENSNSTTINLNAVNGNRPTIRKRPSKSYIDEIGGQANFHCVATGAPLPHIFWFKKGELIQTVDTEIVKGKVHSILKLRELKMSDAGTYKCIARNKMGEDQTDYTLEVIENPKPPRIVSLEPASAIINEGEAIIFWCEVHGKPGQHLHIKWFKRLNKEDIGESINLDDITLFRSGSTYYRPLNVSKQTGTSVGVYKSNLLIRNSCTEDAGTYVCLALNDKGYNFKNATLHVLKPKVKSSPSATSHPSYFSPSDTNFIVTGLIGLGIIVTAVILVLCFYCWRSKSKKAPTRPAMNVTCTKASPTYKSAKQMYPELNDIQSDSKLLGLESVYNYETENHMHAKISFH
ncbi:hypothetical protein JTE90_015851 [Oedothorax gibbosus]|uniref:Ig-like domain-containing protein n=1 Tax=Oedothorax gibbosus TaxID=931172 RepID=A0AAV6VSI7_9ARAC|nr:hypothetical protein JTE90_015851 [Oedothorax gibbosus]